MSHKKPGQTKKAKTAKRKKPSQSHPDIRKVTAKNATHVSSVVRTAGPSPVRKRAREQEERRSAKKKRMRRARAAAKAAEKAQREAKWSNKRKGKHLNRTMQTVHINGGATSTADRCKRCTSAYCIRIRVQPCICTGDEGSGGQYYECSSWKKFISSF